MSQQAPTFAHSGSSHQHASTDRAIRDRTRDALLTSSPNAGAPSPPASPYDTMAKWNQQSEVGAIARYEITQGIVSPLRVTHPSVSNAPPPQLYVSQQELEDFVSSTSEGDSLDTSTPTSPKTTPSHPPSTPTSTQVPSHPATSTSGIVVTLAGQTSDFESPSTSPIRHCGTRASIQDVAFTAHGVALIPTSGLILHTVSESPARVEKRPPSSPTQQARSQGRPNAWARAFDRVRQSIRRRKPEAALS